jgi:chromosome partitioning protein
VLVDADRQGSSLAWAGRRAALDHAVLGIPGLRRDWERHLPADAERVVIDTAAGLRASEAAEWIESVNAVVVPVLPSPIDLEATAPFLEELAALPRVKKGRVPVGLVANRLRPWTRASQQALEQMQQFPFPLVAELRDTQGYVLAHALGKSLFDYHSENVRSHQQDWGRLLRWLRKQA